MIERGGRAIDVLCQVDPGDIDVLNIDPDVLWDAGGGVTEIGDVVDAIIAFCKATAPVDYATSDGR